MAFYYEDMMAQFNSIMEAEQQPETDPNTPEGEKTPAPAANKTKTPKRTAIKFDPVLSDEQVSTIIAAFLKEAAVEPLSKNKLAKFIIGEKNGKQSDGSNSFKAGDLTVSLVPGATAKKANIKVTGDDGKDYTMLAKYDKDAKSVQVAFEALYGGAVDGIINAQIADLQKTEESQSTACYAFLKTIINDENKFHLRDALKYRRPSHTRANEEGVQPKPEPQQPEPQQPEPNTPDGDVLSAEEIIKWATNADYIGHMAVPARPTFNDKADAANEANGQYEQVVEDYKTACEEGDIANAKAFHADATVDKPELLTEWLTKIFEINNDLTEEECVSDEHQRGEYILNRLKGEQPGQGEGQGDGQGENGNGSERTLADDIIDFGMQNYALLGKMAEARPRYGDKLGAGAGSVGYHMKKERAVFNDEQGALENRMKFGEEQAKIKLGMDRGPFIQKWYPELIKEYSEYKKQPNLKIDPKTQEIVYQWLAGAPIRNYKYSVYEGINTMVWDELSDDLNERGTNLSNRIRGYGKEDLRNPPKDKNSKSNKGGKSGGRLNKFVDFLNAVNDYDTLQTKDPIEA